MNRSLSSTLMAAALGAALLSGCQTLGSAIDKMKPDATPEASSGKDARPAANGTRSASSNGSQPPAPQLAADQQALKDGIDLYNKGSYNEAIKRLAAPEMASAPKATQLTALKYSAFSYCVTLRQTLCQKQFEKAFKLDSSFDLLPGEHGHPLWGPVFTRAKKAK